eukprot:TRINITY_DN1543_c0_g1_i2.p1 TRINITY_DN1543_c0_g1~~TRINITY_DN1543_c0_g1_i2.p1  ORF type:complete len:1607 (+),score=455.79 TRINITY_DN1543_c0_g1_i2:77-4822(+)
MPAPDEIESVPSRRASAVPSRRASAVPSRRASAVPSRRASVAPAFWREGHDSAWAPECAGLSQATATHARRVNPDLMTNLEHRIDPDRSDHFPGYEDLEVTADMCERLWHDHYRRVNASRTWRQKLADWLTFTGNATKIDIVQTVLAFASAVMYVWETYLCDVEGRSCSQGGSAEDTKFAFDVSELVMTVLFTADYVLRLLASHDIFAYVTSLFAVVDLITFLPVYASLVYSGGRIGKGGVGFVRVVRLLRLVRVLKAFRVFKGVTLSPVTKAANVLAFTALSQVFICAGFMSLLEGPTSPLGDDYRGENATFPTFFDSIYFTVVTLSTVGYGDFSPRSDWGKLVAVCFILSFIVIIPVQTRHLIELLGQERREFVRASSNRKFVVLAGKGLGFSEIIEFSMEFFHWHHTFNPGSSSGDETNENLIATVLTTSRATQDTRLLLTHPYYKRRLEFRMGSLLRDEDLRVLSLTPRDCLGCFVMAQRRPGSSDEEREEDDRDCILQALNFRRFVQYDIPCSVIINSLSSKRKCKATSAKTVICLDELRLRLMGQSCLCPGLSTFVINFITTYYYSMSREHANDDASGAAAMYGTKAASKAMYTGKPDGFEQEFHRSLANEIYTMPCPPALVNRNFMEVALVMYLTFEITCLGVETAGDGNGDDAETPREFFLAPGHRYTLRAGDQLAVVALDRSSTLVAAQHADWLALLEKLPTEPLPPPATVHRKRASVAGRGDRYRSVFEALHRYRPEPLTDTEWVFPPGHEREGESRYGPMRQLMRKTVLALLFIKAIRPRWDARAHDRFAQADVRLAEATVLDVRRIVRDHRATSPSILMTLRAGSVHDFDATAFRSAVASEATGVKAADNVEVIEPKQVPALLRIVGPGDVSGVYRLCPAESDPDDDSSLGTHGDDGADSGYVNGEPCWENADKGAYLFSTPSVLDARWVVTTDRRDFGYISGPSVALRGAEPHRGLMPHRTRSGWMKEKAGPVLPGAAVLLEEADDASLASGTFSGSRGNLLSSFSVRPLRGIDAPHWSPPDSGEHTPRRSPRTSALREAASMGSVRRLSPRRQDKGVSWEPTLMKRKQSVSTWHAAARGGTPSGGGLTRILFRLVNVPDALRSANRFIAWARDLPENSHFRQVFPFSSISLEGDGKEEQAGLSGHIILTGGYTHLCEFIQTLRARIHLTACTGLAVVVLNRQRPPPEVWVRAMTYTEIYYVEGDPTEKNDLLRAGIEDAHALAILAPEPKSRKDVDEEDRDEFLETLDAQAVFTVMAAMEVRPLSIDPVTGMHTRRTRRDGSADDRPPLFITIELRCGKSVRLLRDLDILRLGTSAEAQGDFDEMRLMQKRVEVCRKRHEWHDRMHRVARCARGAPSSLGESVGIDDNVAHISAVFFAAGYCVSNQMLEPLLPQSYFNRHLLTVVEAFTRGSTRAFGPYLGSIPVPKGFVGKEYGELFHHLAVHKDILALGLYRGPGQMDMQGAKPEEVNQNYLPYVYTNPVRSAVLREGDSVFVVDSSKSGCEDALEAIPAHMLEETSKRSRRASCYSNIGHRRASAVPPPDQQDGAAGPGSPPYGCMTEDTMLAS